MSTILAVLFATSHLLCGCITTKMSALKIFNLTKSGNVKLCCFLNLIFVHQITLICFTKSLKDCND